MFVDIADPAKSTALRSGLTQPVDAARGWPCQRKEQLDQGGFARPVRTEQAKHFTWLDTQAHSPNRAQPVPAEQASRVVLDHLLKFGNGSSRHDRINSTENTKRNGTSKT